ANTRGPGKTRILARVRRKAFLHQVIPHETRELESPGIALPCPGVILQVRNNSHAVLHGRNKILSLGNGLVIPVHESHDDETGIAVLKGTSKIPVHFSRDGVRPGCPREEYSLGVVNRRMITDDGILSSQGHGAQEDESAQYQRNSKTMQDNISRLRESSIRMQNRSFHQGKWLAAVLQTFAKLRGEAPRCFHPKSTRGLHSCSSLWFGQPRDPSFKINIQRENAGKLYCLKLPPYDVMAGCEIHAPWVISARGWPLDWQDCEFPSFFGPTT